MTLSRPKDESVYQENSQQVEKKRNQLQPLNMKIITTNLYLSLHVQGVVSYIQSKVQEADEKADVYRLTWL